MCVCAVMCAVCVTVCRSGAMYEAWDGVKAIPTSDCDIAQMWSSRQVNINYPYRLYFISHSQSMLAW